MARGEAMARSSPQRDAPKSNEVWRSGSFQQTTTYCLAEEIS